MVAVADRAGDRGWRWCLVFQVEGQHRGARSSRRPAGSERRTSWGKRCRGKRYRSWWRRPQRGDLPVYFNGLGTVTAFNTVTVRSRVDGQIVKINFTEGQTVHQGDALVEIDPRPYQVQLEQAEGQLAKDQAQLRDVQVDYERYPAAV